jgi:putative ABC transport system permease protein
MVSTLVQDLRFAARMLVRRPSFAAVAVATLAVVIGVNSGVLSLVDRLFLRPLVPDRPAEVVNIFTARKEANRDYRRFSCAEFSALREANAVSRDVSARSFTFVRMGRDDARRRRFAFVVSDDFFSRLGAKPLALGGVSGVALLAAILACSLPARRGARVDPAVALRWE